MKSIKFKIQLDKNQELILNTLSNEHRLLYNHLLDWTKKNKIDFKQLNEQYKIFRNTNLLTISSKSAQNTCRKLIENIKSYLTLKKKDKSAKFPYKFKSHKYFTSFMIDWNNGGGGFKINDNKLIINLLSSSNKCKKLTIELNEYVSNIINGDNIRTITFKKEYNEYYNEYYLCLTYSTVKPEKVLNKDNFLSIDPGMKNIVTGFSNVNKWFKIKNMTYKSLEKQIAECRSRLDKKVKNSNKWNKLNYRYRLLTERLKNSNKDFQHKVTSSVVKFCENNDIGTIIYGDIKTKKLIKNKEDNKNKNKGQIKGHNKSSQNRGTLSRCKMLLESKSNNINIDFYRQEESYTSKINCLTNKLFDFKLTLDIREVEIDNDLKIDRDLNGSINIAKKAKVAWFNQINLKEYIFNLNRIYI